MSEISLFDFLMKGKAKRVTQVVYPKDASLILAYTTPPVDGLIVTAGAGSGFLLMFLAYYCRSGKVVGYEINPQRAQLVEENVDRLGLDNVVIKAQDIFEGMEEKDVDLIVLDMMGADRMIGPSCRALKPRGWLAVCSPYVEQVMMVVEGMRTCGFREIKVVENLLREWEVKKFGHTLPQRWGNVHTVFITLGRKTEGLPEETLKEMEEKWPLEAEYREILEGEKELHPACALAPQEERVVGNSGQDGDAKPRPSR